MKPCSSGPNIARLRRFGQKARMPAASVGPNILIILHQEQSTPGRIGWLLQQMGCQLDIRRPALGDPLPGDMRGHDGAIIFGGPMSANDPDDYIKREIDWIARPLEEQKPFLGVCLGAQMLSKQLGGEVGPHPEGSVEIGYHPLTAVNGGCSFAPLPGHVYQWHREGLTLPQGAVCQARSETFDNQAFRYGPAAFGIQFHPEVTRMMMHRWVVKAAHRLHLPGAQPAHEQLADHLRYDRPVADWLQKFLPGWLQAGAVAEAAQ
jgi:GMP synthase (glutamine-hydrolysing)